MVLVEELGLDRSNASDRADVPLRLSELDTHGLLALGFLGIMEYERGQLRAAEVLAAEGLKIARHRGWARSAQANLVHLVLAMVFIERNRLGEAQRALDPCWSARHDVLTPAVRIAVNVAQARLDLAGGRARRAKTVLTQLRSSVETSEPPVLTRRWLTLTEAEADLATGRASAALERVRSFPHAALGSPEALSVIGARAELALGNPAQAESILAPVRERSSNPVVGAEAWLVTALAADRGGQDHAALVALDCALSLGEQQDALRPFLASDRGRLETMLRHRQRLGTGRRAFIDNLMAEIGTSEDIPASRSRLISPLTPREHMVLRHLATTQSNEEIGEELYISINTVKAHAKSVYQKLSVSRRGEAVTKARALGLL